MPLDNIFSNLPDSASEVFETLIQSGGLKLERIISSGQATPKGEWLSQEWDEWVMLLAGGAALRFEDDEERIFEMRPGDCINIPARRRHRVERTDSAAKTVWLALHYSRSGS